MPSRSESKKRKLADLLPAYDVVDATAWSALKHQLDPISDSYLRQLLKASGHPLAPEIEGVNTRSFEDLERTLTALEHAYATKKHVRSLVIEAKDHLRWHRAATARERTDEMLLWVMTWLENPALFTLWLKLRKQATTADQTGPDSSP